MEEIGNTLGMANSSFCFGQVYVAEGNLNKAFSHLEKSLNTYEKIGAQSKLCQNYIALAEAYVAGDDFVKPVGRYASLTTVLAEV